MSTFGCHNCKVDLSKYENVPWDKVPCATCQLSKNYVKTFSTGFFDTGGDEDSGPAVEDDHSFSGEHDFVTKGDFPLKLDEIRSLESIQKAVEHQMYLMFSGIMIKLLRMAKDNPTMFEVVIKKMQYPRLSYAEVGNTMNPKCSKQNVLYHLRCAVAIFPELESIIPTDTRYTSGHYALRTLANKRRQELLEDRMRENLYGKGEFSKPVDIEELNKLLAAPFAVRDEVFDFNPYLSDEEYIDEHLKDKD